MFRSLLCAVLVLSSGCHAKFKKNAPTLGQVKTQVILTGGPYVNLGKVSGGDSPESQLVSAAINIAQTVNEINVGKDFAQRVDPMPLNQTMTQGLLETIQNGPPFALTTDDSVKNLLQIEVLSYGLNVPYLGAPGQFTFDVRARIYRGDNGDRVYSTSLTCDSAAGDPSALAMVTGTVNNIKQLDQMSDEQLQATFNDMAYWCGTYFATRMRKHAG